MGVRLARLATVIVMAVVGVPVLGATSATAMPTGMAATLDANPGSVRTGDNTVLLKTGLVVRFQNDRTSAGSPATCPSGWACFWIHANFEGVQGAIRQGDAVWFRDYWYFPSTGYIVFSPSGSPGPEFLNLNRKVSSIFNNTGVTAGYHAYFNVGYSTYPPWTAVPYVGDLLNDSFDKACICNP